MSWLITITPICARNLLGAEINKLSDPYVKCKYKGTAGNSSRTETVPKTRNPTFSPKRFEFSPKPSEWENEVAVIVMDADSVGKDDFLGEVNLPIGGIVQWSNAFVGWFQLQSRGKQTVEGEILLQIESCFADGTQIDVSEKSIKMLGIPPNLAVDTFGEAEPLSAAEAEQVFNEYEARVLVSQAEGLSTPAELGRPSLGSNGTYTILYFNGKELAKSEAAGSGKGGELVKFTDNAQATIKFRWPELLLLKAVTVDVHFQTASNKLVGAVTALSLLGQARLPLETMVARPSGSEHFRLDTKGKVKVEWNVSFKGVSGLGKPIATPKKRNTLIEAKAMHPAVEAESGYGDDYGAPGAGAGAGAGAGGDVIPAAASPDKAASRQQRQSTLQSRRSDLPTWAAAPIVKKKNTGFFGLFCGCGDGSQTGGDDDAKY